MSGFLLDDQNTGLQIGLEQPAVPTQQIAPPTNHLNPSAKKILNC